MNIQSGYKQDGEARRDAILAFVRAFRAAHGYSPSVREIGAAVGIASTSVIGFHLQALSREGRMVRTPGVARSYVPVD
jgi:repressor LexA